ncbi:MAG: four helix bundle suffix domain-containing protein [Muribaculaceae bacterium]|nr:four helix bundle suffix domain-containing protein [Muribaculaceae bacterium]
MNPAHDFARPKTSYRKLYAFQKAEAIYDLTYFFLQNHIAKSDRTYDQMLQAARSGKQNIVEGRSDAASSAEMEIKLYGVARGSLHELLNDYLDFMRTRNITIWEPKHPRSAKLRETCKNNNDTNYFIRLAQKLNDEELTNLIVTLIYQCIAMIGKMIDLVKSDFLTKGGVREQMTRARLSARNNKQ